MMNRSPRAFHAARSCTVTGIAALLGYWRLEALLRVFWTCPVYHATGAATPPAAPWPPPAPWPPASGGGAGEAVEAVGDRQAAVLAEGAAGHLGAGRRLAALVLGAVDHAQHPLDDGGVEALRHDLLCAGVVLDVAVQDRVEDVVVRQRVGVELAGPQLSGRRLVQHRLRDHHPQLVAPACQPVDQRLGDVAA